MAQRVLIILEGGNVYPSGFIRGLIYKDCFERAGIEVKYVSRLWPPLVRVINFPPRFLLPLMTAGLTKGLSALQKVIALLLETFIVQTAKQYDVVYMSKVKSFRLISRLRRNTRARLVLDFGDALWLPRNRVDHLSDILQLVDAVTTDNELTAAYIRQFNQNCTVIPDCPQVESFDQQRATYQPSGNDAVTLGWIGTPGTVYNLYVIWEALERLFAKHANKLHLRLVGVGVDTSRLPPFERVQFSYRPTYSQAEMIQEVMGMDIGLFPLQDVEASRVRGVLKATVYMAGEAAVVCSPVGQSASFIQDGVNGLLADSSQEWEEKIEWLIANPALRQKIARTGLEVARAQFSVEQSFLKLCAVLNLAHSHQNLVEEK